MKTTKKPKLIPPDTERCQAERVSYRPFIMGGNVHQRERCANKPTVISTEIMPRSDGLRGRMSLCDDCLAVMLEQLGPKYATTKPIK